MYHYFYRITNKINGKYYFGVHSTNNLNDGYMGSGVKLQYAKKKYGKSNFTKEIIKFFDTLEAAYEYESEVVTEHMIQEKNCYNVALGGVGGAAVNRVIVKGVDGSTFMVRKDDPRYLSGELISINVGKVTVKDQHGNKFRVDRNDPRYLSGELVGVAKGTIAVKDQHGNKFRVDRNDPRYLSGELVGVAKDKNRNFVIVEGNDGSHIAIDKKDPRYLSGELIAMAKNRIWIHRIKENRVETKMVFEKDLPKYIGEGFQKGRYDNGRNKQIRP